MTPIERVKAAADEIVRRCTEEITDAYAKLAVAEKELGRPVVMEEWPRHAQQAGKVIYSEDFQHDVSMTISGDFESPEQRLEYATEICRCLNIYTKDSNAR